MSELVPACPSPCCRAFVIVPVFNEAETLAQCLQALCGQSVPHRLYEVIVLLNNCTDSSTEIARQFQVAHPEFALHLVERWLSKKDANVGTVRRMLMNEASRRAPKNGVILSTDGDTVVQQDWVEQNLALLEHSADAVGGDIALHPAGFAKLPSTARLHYLSDARYLEAITRLEAIVDPDPNDPWPRHYHHFGASLACTNALYTKLGGLPRADCLEDVEFVKNMVRADARLRHSPQVKVVTAARVSGRARVGLASQLREWGKSQDDPLVDTPSFLKTYYSCRAQLREMWSRNTDGENGQLQYFSGMLGMEPQTLRTHCQNASTFGQFHDLLDLRGRLWRRMPAGRRIGRRSRVTEHVIALNCSLLSEEHPADTSLPGRLQHGSTPAAQGNSHAPGLPSLGSRGQTA